MSYLLLHTAGFLLLGFLLWLPGWVLAPRFLRGGDDLTGLARICLGLGTWIAVVFGLCATRQFHAPAVWTSVAGLGLVAGWTFKRRSASAPSSGEPRRLRPKLLDLLGILALLGLLLPLYILAMTPAIAWDSNVYHLALPKLFLAHEGFRSVPMNVYGHWPLNTELLFGLAMLGQDYVLAKLVHFGFGLLVLYAVYVGCRSLHKPAGSKEISGWLAMALLLGNDVVGYEFSVAYVDLAHAFFLTAAFLFTLRGLDDPEHGTQPILLAGICCGLVAGTKLSGIAGTAVLATLWIPRLVQGKSPGLVRRLLVWFALPVLVLWAPWLFKSTWFTGNPFYPLLHDSFGGPDWSASLAGQLQAWHDGIGMGHGFTDYLLLPLRVILQGGPGYDQFDGEIGSFWIVVLPLALWGARRQQMVRRALAVAGLYFVFWALSSQQMRLLVPILPLLAIAGAVTITELLAVLGAARLGSGIALTLAAVLAFWTHQARIGRSPEVFGLYLETAGDLKATAVLPVYRFLDDGLPDGARVLLLNTNFRFFTEREVLADSFFEASQIREWLGPDSNTALVRQRLAARGITHLLIDRGGPRTVTYPPGLVELMRDARWSRPVFGSPNGRYSVVALR